MKITTVHGDGQRLLEFLTVRICDITKVNTNAESVNFNVSFHYSVINSNRRDKISSEKRYGQMNRCEIDGGYRVLLWSKHHTPYFLAIVLPLSLLLSLNL